MGCDIHFYAERRIDGKWVTADKWAEDKYEPGKMSVYYKDQLYHDRSYDLFSILANVRNGSGFAGVKMGEGFIPISMPRGIPDDCCDEFRKMTDDWGCDGHSHSWLTLAEILAFDWTQRTGKQGWVTPVEWAKWRDQSAPEAWSGGVGGGSTRHLENDAFEAAWQQLRAERGYPEQRNASVHLNTYRNEGDLARFNEIIGGGSPYTLVKWSIAYYESAASFWGKTIPQMLALGKPDDIRAVFFFDN